MNVEKLNPLIHELLDITDSTKVSFHYKEGIWPDIDIYIDNLRTGERIENKLEISIAILFRERLEACLTKEEDAVKFYAALQKFWNNNNLRPLPLFARLVQPGLDIEFIMFVAMPDELQNASLNAMKQYAIENVARRFRTPMNPSGLYTNEADALIMYAMLLRDIILDRGNVVDVSDPVIVKTVD